MQSRSIKINMDYVSCCIGIGVGKIGSLGAVLLLKIPLRI